jgi:RNA polymerase-associated protein
MSQTAAKHPTVTLYAGENDLHSQQVQIVLAEKEIQITLIKVDPARLPDKLQQLNPYGSLPTLIDRGLVLYKTSIITEYLDERFPHPPLLPVYPIARAERRHIIHHIERDLYPLLQSVTRESTPDSQNLACLQNSLARLAPFFSKGPYFMGNEFSLVDCCIAPLVSQLAQLGITLANGNKAINNYRERIFKRPALKAFKTSLE